MPRKVASSSSPELREPYDRYLYADLRHELTVRGISCTRTGPQRVTGRAGFIRLLRDWDKAHSAQTSTRTQTQTRRTQKPRSAKTPQNQKLANVKPTPKKKPQPPPMSSSSTRVIRARRGCRFRLINALLSPDFNGRWGEMAAAGEVNQFWLDVHAAFSAQNSMLDALHFQDALFVNVTPNVILPHAAARLLQMWTEIVAMYRNAVAQAKEAAAHNDNAHSFFDFCAGRLDLLYLHMAMLLEPQLSEFIMSDKIQNADPFSGGRGKGKAAAVATVAAAVATPEVVNNSKQAEADDKPESKLDSKPEVAAKTLIIPVAKPAPGKAKVVSAPEKPKATPAPEKPTAISAPVVVASAVVAAPAAVPAPVKPPRGLTQNPEMEEDPTLDEAKPPATVAPAKTMTAAVTKPAAKAKQAKPVAPPQKPAAQKKTQNATGKAKAASGAGSAKETKQTASTSNQKSPSKSKAPSKPANRKSPIGTKPVTAQKSLTGKRQREEEDNTAIVEVPSVSDIVPHSGKRIHTTTAISTALTTRPSDMMLPPDEWDILESRLRKVNENIDRCHRGLAGGEANVSDSYKQSLEADLRFYSAIKQRLQEQLLVVMQSGY
ncbi:hypothetical protein PF005_g4862 [Phytophthora fragariae]|uniref:Uncharacterized protein n=1 Tax=Phytophthora fragariae TaxID=53985 RepID=A0A6A3FGY3_9STRA|nr:hypothetical protein PF003_g2857 [Phytophthora fragariae]KAE8945075.1 hypothetical protein PF009_g5266 [Phytophthora fragariae]KAE9129474.1 hypothetical protein PF010_g4183 [Phytophthora fragariae]KAE9129606.1 hypothetical protein PF007_g4824 [Phytophthora fragariae]KAE9151796.1 hypothetical protein PF006_g3928 [Phytophthora fragariae]